jgi:hypothetical protein
MGRVALTRKNSYRQWLITGQKRIGVWVFGYNNQPLQGHPAAEAPLIDVSNLYQSFGRPHPSLPRQVAFFEPGGRIRLNARERPVHEFRPVPVHLHRRPEQTSLDALPALLLR